MITSTSTSSDISPSTSFTLENFSTELLVECILQQLDNITLPKAYVTASVPNGLQWDDTRKWVRLTETLLHCLKSDVKNCKVGNTCAGGRYGETRDVIATIVSQWFPDLQQLRSVYIDQISDKVGKVDSVSRTNELEHLFHHVETLYNLAMYVYSREQKSPLHDDDSFKRDEVVFLYDNISENSER